MSETAYFTQIIDKTLKLLKEKTNSLPDLIYNLQNIIARIGIVYLEDSAEGWALKVLDDEGNPFFNAGEANIIEQAFKHYGKQSGGVFGRAYESMKSGMGSSPLVQGLIDPVGYQQRQFQQQLGQATAPLTAITQQVQKNYDTARESVKTSLQEGKAKLKAGLEKTQAKVSGLADGAAKGVSNLHGKLTQAGIDPSSTLGKLQKHYDDLSGISIDNAYVSLTQYLDYLDEQNREYSKEIGILHLVNGMEDIQIPIPYTPFKIPVSPQSIPYFVSAILELIRVSATHGFFKSDLLRKLMSVVIAIFDVLRGEWKHGLLTLLGFFSEGGVATGITLKMLRDAWLMTNPDLRRNFRDDTYSMGKSWFIGVWLWLAASFMPNPYRAQANEFFNDISKKMWNIVPATANKIYTLSDIQLIQEMLSRPEVSCSTEIQKVLEPMIKIPIFRFVFELMGVATNDYFKDKRCKGLKDKPLGEIVAGKSAITAPSAATAPPEIITQQTREIPQEGDGDPRNMPRN